MALMQGGMAGPFIALANQVADAMAAVYPGMSVDTLACKQAFPRIYRQSPL